MSDRFRLRPSPTLAINELSAQLAAQGRTIHRLGFGQSPFPPPARIVEALRENAWRREYLPSRGWGSCASAWHPFIGIDGIQVETADVLVGPGSKELIFLLQLVQQSELLLPAPSWVSYEPQARLLRLPAAWLPTRAADGWRLDPDALDRHCASPPDRPRMLILNYPKQPRGNQPRRIEAAGNRPHRPEAPPIDSWPTRFTESCTIMDGTVSIARYYPEGTIVTGGLSKWCGVGGWRLGAMCVPRALRHVMDAACSVASETYSGVSAPVQYAAVAAYCGGRDIEDHLIQERRVLAAVGKWAGNALNRAGVATTQPDGAVYLFPDFTGLETQLAGSCELCRSLMLDAGVALLPGEDFGRPPSELTCRLAYVNFDGERALATAAKTPELDENYVRAQCPDVSGSIHAIVTWVQR